MAQESLVKIGVFVSPETARRLESVASSLRSSTSAVARLVLDLGVAEAERRVEVLAKGAP